MLGAIIGDIVGSRFEFNNIKTKEFELFGRRSKMTDDSIMTTAIMEVCLKRKWDDKKSLINILKKWGQRYPNAGYGARFFYWVLSPESTPYNSCGNGSAMRVSAAGWYGNNEEEVKYISDRVTEITHNHPEGMKGAEVVAKCIYYARTGKSREYLKEYILSQYPEVANLDYEELRRTYTHGAEICQESVPQALYCFLISNSFEDCLRTTISIGGDCDTTAAMSCAIAEAFYGDIDESIIKDALNYISEDVLEIIKKVYEQLGVKRKHINK